MIASTQLRTTASGPCAELVEACKSFVEMVEPSLHTPPVWRSGRAIHIELCLSCRTRGKDEVGFCLVSAARRPGRQGSNRACAEEPPYCGAIDPRDRLCLVSVCRECTFTRQQAPSASERPAVSKPQSHLQTGGTHCRRKALLVSSQGQKE